MQGPVRFALVSLLAVASFCCGAAENEAAFSREAVDDHVRAQFLVFGPQSEKHEYFGYVYWHDGLLASAVMRSRKCPSPRNCGLETAAAARRIPAGARVLGEWHTHPHGSSGQLSSEDVRGAHDNRHIDGYRAYYSTPDGEIHSWDPQHDWVQTAMASRVLIGNYRMQTAGAQATPAVLNGAGTPDPRLRVPAARRVSRSAWEHVPRDAAPSHRSARH